MALTVSAASSRMLLNSVLASGVGIPLMLLSLLAMMMLPLPPLLLDVLFTLTSRCRSSSCSRASTAGGRSTSRPFRRFSSSRPCSGSHSTSRRRASYC